jgi:hypothetical protein
MNNGVQEMVGAVKRQRLETKKSLDSWDNDVVLILWRSATVADRLTLLGMATEGIYNARSFTFYPHL